MDSLRDSGVTDDVKKHVDNYIEERSNDILSQALNGERHLRPLVDVATENLPSRKLKIVEVAEGSKYLISDIIKHFLVPEMYQISFTLVHPNAESVKDVPPDTVLKKWENKPSLDFSDVNLFVLNFLNCSDKDLKPILENATNCLKNEGFIIVLQKTQLIPAEKILTAISGTSVPSIKEETLEALFDNLNLNIIGKKCDSFTSSLYLVRKSPVSDFKDSVTYITHEKYDDWVEPLKEKLRLLTHPQDSSVPERIWLVSEGSSSSGIVGLVNCLRAEYGGLNIRCVFIDEKETGIPKFSLTQSFFQEQIKKNLVMNVYQKGSWGSYRYLCCKEDLSTVETEHAYLNILSIGDLSSLSFVESPLKYFRPTTSAVLCHIYYASLNFKDVMVATGRVPVLGLTGSPSVKDSVIGFEFSGRTCDGRRVMGLTNFSAMATTLKIHPDFLIDVPEEWTLEEAATVPVAYTTVYYALIDRARLKKGQRLLIHSGSGGVGQAAITLALSMGCEVFTSVGSKEKKQFLKNKFPQLEERHFCNSRDTTFEQHILKKTNGKGVHVVLNSLAGDKLYASINCLAKNGCFLEIGKYDMVKNSSLGMAIFLKNIQFHGIMLETEVDALEGSIEEKSYSFGLLKQGIADGVVKPLNTTVFNYSQAEQAFRYMATGRHTGKVLLKIRDEEEQKLAVPTPIRVTAMTRTSLDSRKSYIIIGGLGGFGLELCGWLVDRGAVNVVLTSRSGITTGYQQKCMKRWKDDSAKIVISKLNASKLNEAVNLIKLAAKHGPVGGIFNLAMVLKDGLMENQTLENFKEVCESKVETTKNMDQLSRKHCPDLEWFVCFSSAVSGRGNVGSSNYGYANSVMERICEERVTKGLPGLAIQWGAVGDVGVIHETMGSNAVVSGTMPQRINSCFRVLDKFLQQKHPVVSSVVPPSGSSLKLEKGDLVKSLASIFGIKDISTINPEATLAELGMDSLIGVELKQVLEINFNINMSVPELRQLKVKYLKKIGEGGTLDDIDRPAAPQSNDEQSFFGKFQIGIISKDLIPTEVILHMNAATDGVPLFLIHPFDGSVHTLQTLAELLPCPVYGVQYTAEAPHDSIEKLAAFYWEHIKRCKTATESIYLAGYSFGGTITFEMALQAERDLDDHPKIKKLVFLEGSHNVLTVITHKVTSFLSNAPMSINEEILILHSFSRMFEKESLLDRKEMANLKDFEDRISYTAGKIAEQFSEYDSEDIRAVWNLFFKKLEMAFKYSPKQKIKADILFIKASDSIFVSKSLTNLFDLEQVCEGKITSHTVQGNHYTFIMQSDSAKEVAKILKEAFNLQ